MEIKELSKAWEYKIKLEKKRAEICGNLVEIQRKKDIGLISASGAHTMKYEQQGELSKINAEIKSLNIQLQYDREYIRFQILWECAKSYIPVSEKDKFFKKVDYMLEHCISNGVNFK